MGTHGRGIIIIDDISPLRELTDEVLEKNYISLKISQQLFMKKVVLQVVLEPKHSLLEPILADQFNLNIF